jgi:signal transduction histidine kinase
VESREWAEVPDRERSRIAKDTHDVVGAKLAQFLVPYEIALASEAVPAKTRTRLEGLTQLAHRAVSGLDEVVWEVNPANNNLQSFAHYVSHAASADLEALGIHVRHVLPEEMLEEPVSSEARRELFRAAKQVLRNIVKHSGTRQVQLSFAISQQALSLAIQDNGRGLASSTLGET